MIPDAHVVLLLNDLRTWHDQIRLVVENEFAPKQELSTAVTEGAKQLIGRIVMVSPHHATNLEETVKRFTGQLNRRTFKLPEGTRVNVLAPSFRTDDPLTILRRLAIDVRNQIAVTLAALEMLTPPAAQETPTSTVPVDSGITRTDGKRFRIALSFPGAKREFVAAVAELLAAEVGRERVLYDKWHEAEFARPRLAEHLPPLYRERSELIAVFLCADYRNSEWCGLEWDAILDLIKKRKDDAIMLLRFDDTEIAGLYSTHGYVRIAERPAAEIAELILTRWRQSGTP